MLTVTSRIAPLHHTLKKGVPQQTPRGGHHHWTLATEITSVTPAGKSVKLYPVGAGERQKKRGGEGDVCVCVCVCVCVVGRGGVV